MKVLQSTLDNIHANIERTSLLAEQAVLQIEHYVDLRELSTQITTLETNKQTLSAKITVLEKQKDDTEDELISQLKKNKGKSDHIKELEAEVERLRKESAKIKEELLQVAANLVKIKEEIQRKQDKKLLELRTESNDKLLKQKEAYDQRLIKYNEEYMEKKSKITRRINEAAMGNLSKLLAMLLKI